MLALQITQLAKNFGNAPVLRDVSLDVAAGSLIAILGASGSGKTTLLRLIAGFEKPDSGEIHLAGRPIAGAGVYVKPEQRAIGYVAQEGALFPHLSVADNISFGLPRAARRARRHVAELLELLGLPAAYANRAPQSLSGGEQQRVAVARALAPRPKLLLLDEPFSALDAALRAETRAAVAAAIQATGATALLVTHDQAEAFSMGHQIGVLQNGRLAQISQPETLYRHPANPELANFVGDAVFSSGIAANGSVVCALGTLPLAMPSLSGPVEVMIRPEQIKLAVAEQPGSVAAQIDTLTFYGHDALIRLTLKNSSASHVTARAFSQALPAAGSHVWLNVQGPVAAYAAPSHIHHEA